jgi:hypothetical protein
MWLILIQRIRRRDVMEYRSENDHKKNLSCYDSSSNNFIWDSRNSIFRGRERTKHTKNERNAEITWFELVLVKCACLKKLILVNMFMNRKNIRDTTLLLHARNQWLHCYTTWDYTTDILHRHSRDDECHEWDITDTRTLSLQDIEIQTNFDLFFHANSRELKMRTAIIWIWIYSMRSALNFWKLCRRCRQTV